MQESEVTHGAVDADIDLDVLVVTYNNEDQIEAALRSVFGQVNIRPFVYVQDNGSTDRTCEIIRDLSLTLSGNIDLDINPDNPGFASATNSLMRKSSSNTILILNPDTYSHSSDDGHTLRRLCDVASEPTTGVVSPLLWIDGEHVDTACMRREPTLVRSFFSLAARSHHALGFLDRWGYNQPHNESRTQPSPTDAINGAFMLAIRSKVDRVGLMDDRFWMYGEDLDWCRSFRQAGYTNLCVEYERWMHTKGGSENGTRGLQTSQAFRDSMSIYFAKHHPGAVHKPARSMVNLLSRLAPSNAEQGRRTPDSNQEAGSRP